MGSNISKRRVLYKPIKMIGIKIWFLKTMLSSPCGEFNPMGVL